MTICVNQPYDHLGRRVGQQADQPHEKDVAVEAEDCRLAGFAQDATASHDPTDGTSGFDATGNNSASAMKVEKNGPSSTPSYGRISFARVQRILRRSPANQIVSAVAVHGKRDGRRAFRS